MGHTVFETNSSKLLADSYQNCTEKLRVGRLGILCITRKERIKKGSGNEKLLA